LSERQYRGIKVKVDWGEVLREAAEAGRKAAMRKLEELKRQGPKYMVVQHEDPFDKRSPIIAVYEPLLDDLGYAEIRISGRSPLVRWIKKNATNIIREPLTGRPEAWEWSDGDVLVSISKAYPKGYSLYIRGVAVAQYISVQVAGYEAALEVLKKYGVDGWVWSRID